ncbi:hypothetical protein GCM10027515_08370 [Schumannella luteola]|uniref:FHA domain-containing protein n=1 Tax=Schumannella luteola TaxID=472059 RepID=A0A852Y9R8_9MICO|nr:FHA domain-containing protein [Schumannella luteola]NYG98034.1 hypothetical protein [Schumannella luteola]TPX01764.1 FHA domain-containing protein [Schumannella luteola]
MSSSDATGIGVIGIVISLISVLISVGVYVWLGLMLSKLFPHFGSEGWRGWVPVLNVAEILHIGGYSRLLVLLSLVPGGSVVVVIFTALSAHKIGQRLGKPTWYVVLAVVLLPLWAMLLLRGLGGQPGGVAGAGAAGQQQWAGPGYGAGAPATGPAAGATGSVAIPVPMTGAGTTPAPGYAGHDAYAGYGAQPGVDAAAEVNQPPSAAAYGDPAGYAAPGQTHGQQGAYGQAAYGQPAPQSVGDAVDAALSAAHPEHPGAPSVSAPEWVQQGTPGPTAGQPAPLIESPGFSVTSASAAGAGVAPAADVAGPAANYVITPPPGLMPPAAPASTMPPTASAPGDHVAPSSPSSEAGPSAWDYPAPAAAPAPPIAPEPLPASADEAPAPPVADPVPNPWSRPPVTTVEPDVAATPGIAPPPLVAGAPVIPGAPAAPAADPLGLGPVPGAASAGALADEDDDDFGATIVVDPSSTVRWELSLDDGPTYQLIGGTVVLGRKPAGTDPSVHYLAVRDATRTLSKVHARLDREGDTWRIRDLGSTNGVRVVEADGSEHPVPAGDGVLLAGRRFVLGRVAMRLDRLGGAPADAASRVESDWDTEDRS